MVLCAAWNLRGAKSVGQGSIAMFVVLLAPFAVLVAIGLWKAFFAHSPAPAAPHTLAAHMQSSIALLGAPVASPSFAGAVSVALWNYMGWDNASTIAQEVEAPQRNYPRAMLISAALVALTYIVPLLAVALAGVDPAQFSTGAWVDAARTIAGPGMLGADLAIAVVLGGMLNGAGMFNALMLSYARVPYALAQDGLLPRFLARTTPGGPTRAPVPWASVLVCAAAWGMALGLSFERLISIDLVLYGASLLLEFVALVCSGYASPAWSAPSASPAASRSRSSPASAPPCSSVTPSMRRAANVWVPPRLCRPGRSRRPPCLPARPAGFGASSAIVDPAQRELFGPKATAGVLPLGPPEPSAKDPPFPDKAPRRVVPFIVPARLCHLAAGRPASEPCPVRLPLRSIDSSGASICPGGTVPVSKEFDRRQSGTATRPPRQKKILS